VGKSCQNWCNKGYPGHLQNCIYQTGIFNSKLASINGARYACQQQSILMTRKVVNRVASGPMGRLALTLCLGEPVFLDKYCQVRTPPDKKTPDSGCGQTVQQFGGVSARFEQVHMHSPEFITIKEQTLEWPTYPQTHDQRLGVQETPGARAEHAPNSCKRNLPFLDLSDPLSATFSCVPHTPKKMSPFATLATTITLEDIQNTAAGLHEPHQTPILRISADCQAGGYQAICLPLTTVKWQERWKNMCIMPSEGDAGNEATIAAEKEAEAWRKSPSFLLDEVTITRLGEISHHYGVRPMCH